MAASEQSKPTLLTFHGSGSNDTIHAVQLARLSRFLKPYFEIEPLCGPVQSAAGPGILPFFEGCGPYYRWLPTVEAQAISNDGKTNKPIGKMIPELETLIKSAISRAAARGSKVVGLIGFSQGTRVVGGLLQAMQIRKALEKEGKAEGFEWLDFRFGLSVCSSIPPPLLPASVIAAVWSSDLDEARKVEILEAKINIPTLHVLGVQDEWRHAGRLLIDTAYEIKPEPTDEVEKGKGGLFEFNMGHHYPVEEAQTRKIVNWVLGTWEDVKTIE